MAYKQRWYCPVCAARYKTKYGVLCEIKVFDRYLYCLASFPDTELQDAKFMMIEERFKKVQTPEELLKEMPVVKPLTEGEALQFEKEGVYRFGQGTLQGIDTLERDQLFNFVKANSTVDNKA